MQFIMQLNPVSGLKSILMEWFVDVLRYIMEGLFTGIGLLFTPIIELMVLTPYPRQQGSTVPAIWATYTPSSYNNLVAPWPDLFQVMADTLLPTAIALLLVAFILAYVAPLFDTLFKLNLKISTSQVITAFLLVIFWATAGTAILSLSSAITQIIAGGSNWADFTTAFFQTTPAGAFTEADAQNLQGQANQSAGNTAITAIGILIGILLIAIFATTGAAIAILTGIGFWILRLLIIYMLFAAMPLLISFWAFRGLRIPILSTLGSKGIKLFMSAAFASIPAALILRIGLTLMNLTNTIIPQNILNGVGAGLTTTINMLIVVLIVLLAAYSPLYFFLGGGAYAGTPIGRIAGTVVASKAGAVSTAKTMRETASQRKDMAIEGAEKSERAGRVGIAGMKSVAALGSLKLQNKKDGKPQGFRDSFDTPDFPTSSTRKSTTVGGFEFGEVSSNPNTATFGDGSSFGGGGGGGGSTRSSDASDTDYDTEADEFMRDIQDARKRDEERKREVRETLEKNQEIEEKKRQQAKQRREAVEAKKYGEEPPSDPISDAEIGKKERTPLETLGLAAVAPFAAFARKSGQALDIDAGLETENNPDEGLFAELGQVEYEEVEQVDDFEWNYLDEEGTVVGNVKVDGDDAEVWTTETDTVEYTASAKPISYYDMFGVSQDADQDTLQKRVNKLLEEVEENDNITETEKETIRQGAATLLDVEERQEYTDAFESGTLNEYYAGNDSLNPALVSEEWKAGTWEQATGDGQTSFEKAEQRFKERRQREKENITASFKKFQENYNPSEFDARSYSNVKNKWGIPVPIIGKKDVEWTEIEDKPEWMPADEIVYVDADKYGENPSWNNIDDKDDVVTISADTQWWNDRVDSMSDKSPEEKEALKSAVWRVRQGDDERYIGYNKNTGKFNEIDREAGLVNKANAGEYVDDAQKAVQQANKQQNVRLRSRKEKLEEIQKVPGKVTQNRKNQMKERLENWVKGDEEFNQ